jgi:cupin 2 domain-containing protein
VGDSESLGGQEKPVHEREFSGKYGVMTNLFAPLPGPGATEEFLTLAAHAGVRVERIVSRGNVTPAGEWYDQDWAEWVVVVEGAAELTLADPEEIVRLERGDAFFLPAHRRHRVSWTADPTIWLTVHWPPAAAS